MNGSNLLRENFTAMASYAGIDADWVQVVDG